MMPAHAAAELERAIAHGDTFDELLLAQVEHMKLLSRPPAGRAGNPADPARCL